MSGAASRRKGAAYERRVAAWLAERLGVQARRHRGGFSGDDIEHSIPFLSFEAKDRNELSLGAWVDQARTNCLGKIPVVVHHRRGSGQIDGDFFTLDGVAFAQLVSYAISGYEERLAAPLLREAVDL